MAKTVVHTDMAPAAIGPYSQAIKTGGLLFVSGQLPVDPRSGQVASDIEGQTRQVLENLKAILSCQGSTLDAVVKTTVYLKDLNDFQSVNSIYGEYLSVNAPARACVQVARLPKDVLVEIEAIAVL